MNENFPYVTMLSIAKECRNQLIQDTLLGNSPDLFDALYSHVDSEIFRTKMEYYELTWIEFHWQKITDIIDKKNYSKTEKKELISQFSVWYNSFISEWNYSELDSMMFEEKRKILRALISVNNEWDKNIKRMKVSFEQSKKMLKLKIAELERGNS